MEVWKTLLRDEAAGRKLIIQCQMGEAPKSVMREIDRRLNPDRIPVNVAMQEQWEELQEKDWVAKQPKLRRRF
jgi:hypothetical protein